MCFLFRKKRRIQIICRLMQCLCCLCFWAAIWKKFLPVKGNKMCKSVQNVVPRSVSHLVRPQGCVCKGDGSVGEPREDCALSRGVSALQNMNLCPAQPRDFCCITWGVELPTPVRGCAQTGTASLPGNDHQRGSLFKEMETNLSWD